MSPTFDQLIALADEQYALYQQNSDGAAFDLAVNHYCAAFDLGPAPDSTADYVLAYFRFYHALLSRAQEEGQGHDTIAHKYLDKVLELTPPTHYLRPVLLGVQATSYTQRYQRTKDAADLHLAIGTFQSATDTILATHPQRPHLLMQYGSTLYTRYLALQDESDLSLAIQQFRSVIEACPDPLLIPARRALAFALDSRYKLRYDIDDIDHAIEAYAAVVDLLEQPKEYLIACMGYAAVLHARFIRKGSLDDLRVAITYCEVVVRRCPPGHQYYSLTLVFYATLLIDDSGHKESIQDIDKAIECVRNRIATGRVDDPDRPRLVGVLGFCLVSRFLHCGNAADLETAVETCYTAVSMDSSVGAGVRAGNMNHLAFALFTRYQLQGDKMDSIRARSYLQQALELCPLDNPIRLAVLNNYARITGNLAKKNSDITDLELSVKYFYEILEFCYASTRATILTNLTIVLLYRYTLLGDPFDADVAFSLSKTSLELQAEDHWLRGMTFLFQAKAVIAMFSKKYTIVDTEMVLDILLAARDSFTPGHPLLIETYRELSNVHFL